MFSLIYPKAASSEHLVVEVAAATFDVAPPLYWIACPNTVTPASHYYDSSAGSFKPIPAVAQSVPQIVSSTQGGIALIQGGFMDRVQAVIDNPATPAEVKWAWNRAKDWERSSPALAYIAGAAGITDAEMDALFIAAQKIKA